MRFSFPIRLFLILFCSLSFLKAESELTATESDADKAFYRASKVYEYGRNQKDQYESRSALRTAELSFRNYLKNYTGHSERMTAYYRMAVCQLLTGNIDSAEANFDFIINKYKKGQLVAASAYRMGAQRYNEENYSKAKSQQRRVRKTPYVSKPSTSKQDV